MSDIAETKAFLVKNADLSTACRWAGETAETLDTWAEHLTPEAGTQPKGIDDIVKEFAKASDAQKKKALLRRTADRIEAGCPPKDVRRHAFAPPPGWTL